MASASEFDFNMERSPQWEEDRKEMHRAIKDGDETRVKKCLDTVPALKLWLDPDRNVSARYKAVQVKAFRIHGLLVSRDCALKAREESSFYKKLSRLERAEIRRQRFFATEYKESYIHYLKSKSLSQTPCADFETRLERMYTELISVGLISTILKVAATAPHLEIHFDFKSENVQRTTGCRGRSTRGLTFHEDQKVFIAGSAKEKEIWGTFTHEMCHLALYLVYRNNGKPYFRNDTDKEKRYKDTLNDIKPMKRNLDLLIQQAFINNEEQEEELIVRVPHVVAQHGSHDGNVLLERDVPELRKFFNDVVIPDMKTHIQNIIPSIDKEKIKEENARLQKAFNTGELNVTYETPLKRSVWQNRLLHILTGTELRLLEIKVHNAVQSTGQPYLFFEVNQLDFTLTDVLLRYKCAFVLVTVHATRDLREALDVLSEVSRVTGTKVILLVEERRKEDLMKQVQADTFLAKNHEVHSDPKASFEYVKQSCKEEVFKKSCITLQGQDATALSIGTFLRCVDTANFLRLCEREGIDLGPPLHELEEEVKNCLVERVCRRAVEIDLKECEVDEENEAFALLGCSHDYVTKLLPRGYEAKANTDLTQFENFVLLQLSRDYEDLLENCHYRDKIVHLLRFMETSDELLWMKSNGRLSHLPMTENDDIYTMEMLLNVNESVVVISGAPGMGKSVLASRLCTEMKNQNRNTWVLHVDLPRRLASVKTTSLSVGYLAELCQVQEDGLEFALFEESLCNGSPFDVVVVLDAFDEINKKCRTHVLELVSFLIKTKVYKIYILTRAVFKSDLQDALHTVSYELVPFSDENQEEFLRKYREQRGHSTPSNAAVSQQFQELYMSFGARNNKILETPLLLRMMAEMENGEIAESGYSSLLKSPAISADSLVYTVHIYKMFVEYKHLVYRIEKRKEDMRLCAVQEDDYTEKPLFYTSHGILAMKCIFPQDILEALLNEDELEKIETDGSLIKKVAHNRLKEGFVNGINDGAPVFVHKTFAEFFAAEYLLEKARTRKNSRVRNEVVSLYGEKPYEGVMLFFDGLASASFPLHSAVMNNDASYFEKHVIQREDMFNVDELQRTPLHVAALHADRTTLEGLPMDDELIKHDVLDKSPFGYAEMFVQWVEAFVMKMLPRMGTENSVERERLNILCARCNEEALKHSNEILRKYDTFKEKERFVIGAILTAVKDDLQGVLDVYLTYFSPKKGRETLDRETLDQLEARTKRSSRCSVVLQVIGDLDRFSGQHNRTVLFYAKSEAVCKMLLPYCDVGIVDIVGNTMLHISVKEGNLETTQFHLAHSSVDAKNKMGETPFYLSVCRGHEEVIKLLLPLCESVNVRDYGKQTPMDRCAERGLWEIVKLLLLRTRMYGTRYIRVTTPLHMASNHRSLEAVTFLLPHTKAHTPTDGGETGLDLAWKRFINRNLTLDVNFDIVRCLIPHSLVNSPDTLASSPVYVWASCGKRKVLQTLWPYLRQSYRNHALMISRNWVDVKVKVEGFQEEIWCLKLLFLHLDVIAADRYSHKKLHDIIQEKQDRIGNENHIIYTKLFLPHSNLLEAADHLWRTRLRMKRVGLDDGILTLYRRWSDMNNTDDSDTDDGDTEVVDEDVNTVLFISAKEGDVEGVEFHLSHSSVYVTNSDQDTTLHLSAKNGHTSVVKLLFPFYATVDMHNAREDTPMHVCSRNGHLDVAKLLLLRSRLSWTNEYGETPLHLASRSGALDVVTFLLPHSLARMRDNFCKTCFHISVSERKLNVLRCLIPHSLVNCPDRFYASPVKNCAKGLWSEELVTLLPYSSDYDVNNLLELVNLLPYSCGCDVNNLLGSCASCKREYSPRRTRFVKLMALFSNINAVDGCCRKALRYLRKERTEFLSYIKLFFPLSNVFAKGDEWKNLLQRD